MQNSYPIESIDTEIDGAIEEINNQISEKVAYTEMIKYLIDSYYEKSMVFYLGEGKWYSREHCTEIDISELDNWVFAIVNELT